MPRFTFGDFIGGLTFVFVVPSISIAALTNNGKFDDKKHKAISKFNNSMGIGGVDNPKSWDLKLGTGQYGYGLVLNF